MSSHHFVREGQEPALFIIDALPFEIAAPLLEWAPYVVVMDSALSDVITWGVKIDAVVTAKGNVEVVRKLVEGQEPVAILESSGNLFQAGLQLLREDGQKATNILSQNPGPTMIDAELFTNNLQISVMDKAFRWSCIRSGQFEKWVSTGATLKKHSRSVQAIETQGLLEDGDLLIAQKDGMVRIFSTSAFWVAEAL